MSFHGLFIGIGKYADDDVQDLPGAGRDAIALHALFADTLGDSQTVLLVDSDATTTNVRSALESLERAVGADDTVVLYFSGHGSHDHRLAMHDTSLADLPATTISMQDIAAFFKRTAARSALFVLDCCFSGGAPAKVLESSPIPRDATDPFEGIVGEGRILLTACKLDEVAYESPITGHGVLTKALLDLLCSAAGPVNLLSAMDKILETVRAEAARMGIIQTPVLLGSVTGGLVLPKLSPGVLFQRAFPEYSPIKLNGPIEELRELGFPDIVVQAWNDKYPGGLNELQISALNDYRIAGGASLLVVAPTSSGKTFVGEIAAAKAITEGRKAVFLFPYKALVNEKYDQFLDLYGDRLGMRVIRCTGDYSDGASGFIRGKYDLAVLTYEMFLQLVVSFPAIRNQLGLLVLDEAQFITDPSRGINVELLLTYILAGREVGAAPQLIALSAVIGNANSFHDWLGCGLLMSDKRPIPLLEGVIDRSGVYEYVDASGASKSEQMIPSHDVIVRTEKPSAQDLIVPLVRKLVNAGEKVIVFRNQRGSAQGCANYLARDLGLPPAEDVIPLLATTDGSGASAVLRNCLQGGTAFHTRNLMREERAIVEKSFRDPDSRIRVLAATTTVAAGINTPASTVILAEQEFLGEDGRPFTVAEYKNMAGRAGRLGFRESGKSIIYAESASERDRLFRTYVLGRLESLHSSFEGRHLDTWILRLLAQVRAVPRDEVVRLLANTYAGYLENRRDPNWRKRAQADVENLLARMLRLGLLETEGGNVSLTLLGRACGRSALSFDSALRLVELIRFLPPALLTAVNMMAIVQVLEEADGYTPMLGGQREAIRTGEAAQRYGNEVLGVLQRFAESTNNYWARCKRAAVIFDWISGVRVDEIEARFSTTTYRGAIGLGDITGFADTTRFVLRSAGEILALTIITPNLPEQLDMVLNQLEVGLPSEAMSLLDLPITLTRGQYLDLNAHGIRTRASLRNADSNVLKTILPPTVIAALEKLRAADSATAGGGSVS